MWTSRSTAASKQGTSPKWPLPAPTWRCAAAACSNAPCPSPRPWAASGEHWSRGASRATGPPATPGERGAVAAGQAARGRGRLRAERGGRGSAAFELVELDGSRAAVVEAGADLHEVGAEAAPVPLTGAPVDGEVGLGRVDHRLTVVNGRGLQVQQPPSRGGEVGDGRVGVGIGEV